MKCASCQLNTIVKDSRRIEEGVWRRRSCNSCGLEFTTIESVCETLANPNPRNHGKIKKIVIKEKVQRPKRPRKPKEVIPKPVYIVPAWKKIQEIKDKKEIENA